MSLDAGLGGFGETGAQMATHYDGGKHDAWESTTAELGTDTLHSIAYGLALETYLLIPARLLRHAGMSLEATAFAASGEQLSPIWRGATRAGRSERRSPQCQG
jgi:hypothetical protein